MRTFFLASASILALGASSAVAEEATTNQHGAGGRAYINQANDTDDAMATITQGIEGTPGNSTGDVASIYQTGKGDVDAEISQNTGDIGGGGNLAGLVQTDGTGTDGAVDDTTAMIMQDGSSNRAGVRQQGTDNDGSIKQYGEANYAVVKQGDARNETFDVLNNTTPSAEENWQALNFDFDQDKVSGHSRDTPPGGIEGFPDPDPEGIVTNSEGMVDQMGDSNKAAILQVTGSDHKATIRQLVGGNEARALQAGSSQDALIEQEGANNGADVRQQNGEGTGDHSTEILQSGDWNVILVDQTGTENDASVEQAGSDNYASIEQQGMGDMVEVSQSGDGNVANVFQDDDGVMSTANVTQSGGENISVINQ